MVDREMARSPVSYLLIALGSISFALGVVALFLPIVPSTPFFILAAYCFSKGSRRLHRKIMHLPYVGPAIRNWEETGAIPLGAKIWTTVLIVALVIYIGFFEAQVLWLRIVIIAVGVGALSWMWTRPSRI